MGLGMGNLESPQRGRQNLDRFCRPLRGLAILDALAPTACAVGYRLPPPSAAGRNLNVDLFDALHQQAAENLPHQFPGCYIPPKNVIPSKRRLATRVEESFVLLCRGKTQDPSTPFHFGRDDASNLPYSAATPIRELPHTSFAKGVPRRTAGRCAENAIRQPQSEPSQ